MVGEGGRTAEFGGNDVGGRSRGGSKSRSDEVVEVIHAMYQDRSPKTMAPGTGVNEAFDDGRASLEVEVAGVGESDCLVESRKESGKTVSADPDRQKDAGALSTERGLETLNSLYNNNGWLILELLRFRFLLEHLNRNSQGEDRFMYYALVLMSNPRFLFVCCSLFPASCWNQPFFPPRSFIDTSGRHFSGDQPIRSLPILSYTIPITYGLAGNLSLETGHGLYFITPDTLSVAPLSLGPGGLLCRSTTFDKSHYSPLDNLASSTICIWSELLETNLAVPTSVALLND